MMFFEPKHFLKDDAVVNVTSGTTFMIPVLCLVLITLLNDGCILSIAYDLVVPSARPTEWKLKEYLNICAASDGMEIERVF